ncbi:hypothetical protein RJ639_034557 [Escallonia herrerae]|uniref:Peptidase M24 domain-containing protein n=1 Tax=Escallonia herrerae TaxID=1293975 RepID=A0AA88WT77_9ASTE|nr:hypothetical protein RJ639_034557 [Escallonia herrerae]
MASVASLSHPAATLQLSSSRLLAGAPLTSSFPSVFGKDTKSTKRLVVVSKRISGLEEAIRIRRERELNTSTTSKRRLPLRRGRVSPRLLVPDHIPKPPYLGSNELPEISSEYQIPDAEGIGHMRAACELAARVLDYAGTLVRPSVTTNEIDKAVHQMIIDAGAYPSPLGYGRFPKSVCTSVNECMCHGIPDSRQLQDGDIINIDVTVYLNGYHGDTSKTFLCGNVDDSMKRLVKVTEECLEKGIAVCKDGALFRKIGKRIRCLKFDMYLQTPEYHGLQYLIKFIKVDTQSFASLAAEPILTLGSIKCKTWEDNWTTLTADGSPAAQFEHTILITRTGRPAAPID